ncbi:MAG: hypothetical protein EOP47_26370 [Sphingobacteriaceae bacterium]|nr:MAG: hypothetical protein EOP47_26370 [Sphingobacteriaceae bacterium]
MNIKIKLSVLCLGLFLFACNGNVKQNEGPDTSAKQAGDTSSVPKPQWQKSPKLTLAINTLLSHKNDAFKCDSAIILSYNGVFGEHAYFPLNRKGHLIASIKQRKKLTSSQVNTFNKIVGGSGSFKEPVIIHCFKPNIGVLYFKDGMVIAQSIISLDCAKMKSTAKLGSNDHYSSFSQVAVTKLKAFYNELNLL